MEVQQIKQRFGIIGNSPLINRAIDIAVQVAPTDLSVLITGESGSGKEVFPKIIHQYSARKHESYIAVNCGAIPEGTIDSELFGHEKGSFTGAHDARKGYFEVADKGTIFLDEVGELPLSTQVRLLRVIETGEFIRVGSSKAQKTDVRVVAATNVNLMEAIYQNKFREDLFYRLNTVPITIPSLRARKEDIFLLFRKFANDFAERYRMPSIKLNEDAQRILINFKWPGNVRQLKNITEQISIIEQERNISPEALQAYLPVSTMPNLPAIYKPVDEKTFASEREILYQVLFDMKRDVNDLKKLVNEIIHHGTDDVTVREENAQLIKKFYADNDQSISHDYTPRQDSYHPPQTDSHIIEDTEEYVEESLSLQDKEIELIKKALDKHKGKRKYAAQNLGISERTLYRKIKEYDIDG
ncbi:MAG: sigma-54 dependent transcriptional regulator [Bacteroidales bacterium]|nr:sigma-54 dependent transcriptional regulator [Bacteroidales bacterium]MCF8457853.1 sigma-54 dependent transcriptional regulator [Bacteroidales bacterium]